MGVYAQNKEKFCCLNDVTLERVSVSMSRCGRTVVGGNCCVRIVREEKGAGLGGQWLGGNAG